MKIDDCTPIRVHTSGGGAIPPSIGLTSNALPEVQTPSVAANSQTGVSTRNGSLRKHGDTIPLRTSDDTPKSKDTPQWYALRCTYGREKTAYEHLVSHGITAFYPTINTTKLINGKRKTITESRLPNIFFAFGTEEQLKTFVYDNIKLPYLRFYYQHKHVGNRIEKTPLTVPTQQMESLQIICAAEASDTIVELGKIPQFQTGALVRVKEGKFAGVVGHVKRWQGQQRVGIVVDGLATVVTAYVPKAFLEVL